MVAASLRQMQVNTVHRAGNTNGAVQGDAASSIRYTVNGGSVSVRFWTDHLDGGKRSSDPPALADHRRRRRRERRLGQGRATADRVLQPRAHAVGNDDA